MDPTSGSATPPTAGGEVDPSRELTAELAEFMLV
jgi:hypothetical protein